MIKRVADVATEWGGRSQMEDVHQQVFIVEVYTGSNEVDQHEVSAGSHREALNTVIRRTAERGVCGGPIDSFPVRPPPYPEDAIQVHITAWVSCEGTLTHMDGGDKVAGRGLSYINAASKTET
jgi:hypothetical protein